MLPHDDIKGKNASLLVDNKYILLFSSKSIDNLLSHFILISTLTLFGMV